MATFSELKKIRKEELYLFEKHGVNPTFEQNIRMVPSLPTRLPQLCISLSIALMAFGYLLFNTPFSVLDKLAANQAELSKVSKLDMKSFRNDSASLVNTQTVTSQQSAILARQSPDSIKLMIDYNSKLADRDIALKEFFQKYRPQEKGLEVLSYINKKCDFLTGYTPSLINWGIFFMVIGSIGSLTGLSLSINEYIEERKGR